MKVPKRLMDRAAQIWTLTRDFVQYVWDPTPDAAMFLILDVMPLESDADLRQLIDVCNAGLELNAMRRIGDRLRDRRGKRPH